MRRTWIILMVAACAGTAQARWDVLQTEADRVATISGLSGPEAVRYDPEQDVLFISNFNGENAGDANGFITRARSDGTVENLRFMQGTSAAPLHGPRGMFIVADTLFAADADGVHAFDRRSGAQLRFVDFRVLEPGFLNDIVQGPDGALYITDTGRSRVYRLGGTDISIAIEDSALRNPNGIAWDSSRRRFVLASWNPGAAAHAWDGARGFSAIAPEGPGRNDGIEVVGEHLLLASQTDSSIRVVRDGSSSSLIRTPGRPADIGVDTRRWLVAVPFIALDRVDLWAIPRP